MIPEELHVRNFLSHRETDLDLRGVHLASLVGENGAGKSALLDAITWAVWGRSRAAYGHDEDLVHHGEDTMEVVGVFRIPNPRVGESRCRILRRRERRGRRSISTTLDFQVEGDDGWRVLTSDSIRETQARIIDYLGLDYETFINSAYLRQGHADEFTVQTPAERKRVLSTILGLDRWADYRARAKTQLATAKGQLEVVSQRLDETEAELARRPEYEAALTEAQVQAEAAEAELAEVQAQVDEVTRVQEQALALERQREDLDQRVRQEEARRAQLTREQDEHRARRAYYHDMLAQADAIEASYRTYRQVVEEERAWGEKLSQAARLQTERSQWEQALAEAREALNQRLRAAERTAAQVAGALAEARAELAGRLHDREGQIKLLEEQVPDAALREALDAAQAEQARLVALAQAQEADREALQAAEVERSRLVERNRQLRDLMHAAKERLDALAAAEATCPLCGQPLLAAHREQLLQEIEAEGTAMGDEFRANAARLQALDAERDALQARIRERARALRARPRQEQAVARLQQQMEQGTAAQQRLAQLRERAAKVARHLEAEDYAPDLRARRRTAQEEIARLQSRLEREEYATEAREALGVVLEDLTTLGYDGEAHGEVKARVQALSGAEADYRELEKARVSVEKETEALGRLAQEVEAQAARIADVAETRAARQADLEALQPRLAEAPRLARHLAEARQRETAARQRVGAARQNLAALETLARRRVDIQERREGLARRVATLTELRDAFGVNGIPAMIIEHALPELEREANRLLRRLTDGRMRVRFDTQRETQSGTLRETLDIVISDEKGTRPYETFSGGEQFRVNFAIRVALSRLLAQRAGVRLRSLFVDEGFGALDADGRRRLVEAVKAVQHEFDLVLVITHIVELREAFPTQILVTKTDAGSVVEVL
jgi:exonuclease SbcC